MTVKLCVSL